jgi:type II secretory pathway pseudopilin PulG
LIEVTVAVAIIGTMIVAAGSLFTRIPVDGRVVRDQDLALRIARNEVESLRAVGYDALPASGPFTDALLDSLPSGGASITITDYSAKTKQADVSVSWIPSDGIPRQVSLTTLITQNSGL